VKVEGSLNSYPKEVCNCSRDVTQGHRTSEADEKAEDDQHGQIDGQRGADIEYGIQQDW